MKILVLCHGNINRSPLFAAVLRSRTKHEIRSRGFGPSGKRVPRRMRELARTLGYDLTTYWSQQVQHEDLAWADCIIYMDKGQADRLAAMRTFALKAETRVICAGGFIGRGRVPDPHFLKGAEFERAVKLTVTAAEAACATLTQ